MDFTHDIRILNSTQLQRIKDAKRLAETKLQGLEDNLRRLQAQQQWLRRYNQITITLEHEKKRLFELGKQKAVLAKEAAMLERYTSTADKNMFNYKNEEYDKTYAAAAAATDDAEATALYKQCEKILADTAANVYLMDLPLFVAIDKDLTGYQFYPLYVQDLSTLSWK